MNPIQEWLGLDVEAPNYYQLLGIAESQQDRRTIEVAANRAMARVRSHRPGPHAAVWAELLDQLADAKRCLSDSKQRAEYDRFLQDNSGRGKSLGLPNQVSETAANQQDSYPPAARPDFIPPRETAGFHNESRPPQSEHARADHGQDNVAESTAADDPSASGDEQPPIPFVEIPSDSNAEAEPEPFSPTATTSGNFAVPPATIAAPPAPTGATSLDSAAQLQSEKLHPDKLHSDSQLTGWLVPCLVGMAAALAVLVAFQAPRWRWELAQHFSDAETPGNAAANSPDKERGDLERGDLERGDSEAADTERTGTARADSEPAAPERAASVDRSSTTQAATSSGNLAKRLSGPFRADRSSAGKSQGSARLSPGKRPRVAEFPPPAVSGKSPQGLSAALTAARRAMIERQFSEAIQQIEAAYSLAATSDQRAMVQRLEQLNALVMEFDALIKRGIAALEPGTEIRISARTVVSVVELDEEALTLFVAGRHRRFPTDDLSPGLAMGLVTQTVGAQHPRLPLLKGAYLVAQSDPPQAHLDTVRGWWTAAARTDPVAKDLLQTLDDDYQASD